MLDAENAARIADLLGERQPTHLQGQVEIHRDNIDAFTQQNAEWSQRIAANLQRMAQERDMLNIAATAAEDRSFVEHLVGEWDALREHPRLNGANMNGSTLTLETTDDIVLHCEDREDTRWLGAFEITLNLDNCDIKLRNLHTRRGGRDHPHVVNGNPCFGGDHHVFSQLTADGSLNLLYEMLLQYLEKLNLADEYGRYGSYWFDQPDARESQAAQDEGEVVAVNALVAGERFVCVSSPRRADQPGRRGEVIGEIDNDVEIEWADNGETEPRSDRLRVRAVEAEVLA